MFKLGIIVNPLSGLGGSVALKGTDGHAIVAEALVRGAEYRAESRMQRALTVLLPYKNLITVYGYSGAMGQTVAEDLGLSFICVGEPVNEISDYNDTINIAVVLKNEQVDVILFAGGDGTARNVFDAVGDDFPVVGVPAGVKIHSGVYAINPEGAGKIVEVLIKGKAVPVMLQEVRDIDESAFRQGRVLTQYYGELLVPQEPEWLQCVKNSGAADEILSKVDIATTFIEALEADTLYLIGPGSTTHMLLEELGLSGTLLGVDALFNNTLLSVDLTFNDIEVLLERYPSVKIVVTAIGGQGHIFGRGNQQFTPAILRHVGKDNIIIVATREKIAALEGRPLLLDTNDKVLDELLTGIYTVLSGFDEKLLYPVATSVPSL